MRAVSAAPPAQPPQRVCPRCSTIARTVDARCPYCGSSYRRRGPYAAIFLAAVLSSLVTLAGVLFMLVDFGDRLERELDSQVTVVQRDFDRSVGQLEDRIERELDERLGGVPGR